jgi:integrase
MTRAPSGHIEQLPSGWWRAKVYVGTDPLTGREIRFRETRKTEVEAQIELGKLLALARAGRQPDSDVTVAELLNEYVPVAGWDVSTDGDQPRLHPPHHQARSGDQGSTQGPRAPA